MLASNSSDYIPHCLPCLIAHPLSPTAPPPSAPASPVAPVTPHVAFVLNSPAWSCRSPLPLTSSSPSPLPVLPQSQSPALTGIASWDANWPQDNNKENIAVPRPPLQEFSRLYLEQLDICWDSSVTTPMFNFAQKYLYTIPAIEWISTFIMAPASLKRLMAHASAVKYYQVANLLCLYYDITLKGYAKISGTPTLDLDDWTLIMHSNLTYLMIPHGVLKLIHDLKVQDAKTQWNCPPYGLPYFWGTPTPAPPYVPWVATPPTPVTPRASHPAPPPPKRKQSRCARPQRPRSNRGRP
jgi:hypothetical protein